MGDYELRELKRLLEESNKTLKSINGQLETYLQNVSYLVERIDDSLLKIVDQKGG